MCICSKQGAAASKRASGGGRCRAPQAGAPDGEGCCCGAGRGLLGHQLLAAEGCAGGREGAAVGWGCKHMAPPACPPMRRPGGLTRPSLHRGEGHHHGSAAAAAGEGEGWRRSLLGRWAGLPGCRTAFAGGEAGVSGLRGWRQRRFRLPCMAHGQRGCLPSPCIRPALGLCGLLELPRVCGSHGADRLQHGGRAAGGGPPQRGEAPPRRPQFTRHTCGARPDASPPPAAGPPLHCRRPAARRGPPGPRRGALRHCVRR